MSTPRIDRAYEVTWLVRRLFRALAAEADRYLADVELSAADRAVMEFLHPRHELSVPEIARRYSVSRQHVQVIVNALVARGLLRSAENPQHKRSRLIRLSDEGRIAFNEIRQNEAAVIEQIFCDVSDDALEITRKTLQALLKNSGRGTGNA
jgi:DNA-binding MarR family transcriptional regulator